MRQSRPSASTAVAEVTAAFAALSPEERRDALHAALELDAAAAGVVAPSVADASLVHWWLCAIAEFKLGRPARLVRMVQQGQPMVGVAGTFLSDLVASSAAKPRGRPSKRPAAVSDLHDVLQRHTERVEFWKLLQKYRAMPSIDRSGTPTEDALTELQAVHGLTEDEAKRRAFPNSTKRRRISKVTRR